MNKPTRQSELTLPNVTTGALRSNDARVRTPCGAACGACEWNDRQPRGGGVFGGGMLLGRGFGGGYPPGAGGGFAGAYRGCE